MMKCSFTGFPVRARSCNRSLPFFSLYARKKAIYFPSLPSSPHVLSSASSCTPCCPAIIYSWLVDRRSPRMFPSTSPPSVFASISLQRHTHTSSSMCSCLRDFFRERWNGEVAPTPEALCVRESLARDVKREGDSLADGCQFG